MANEYIPVNSGEEEAEATISSKGKGLESVFCGYFIL